jgi:V/A-type H+-transporting ATPase subunit I
MKGIELSVLNRDIDPVLEFLGCKFLMHLNHEDGQADVPEKAASRHIHENLERLSSASVWLGVPVPAEPWETSRFPGESEEFLTGTITAAISSLIDRENGQREEKHKVEEALNEAKAFASLNAPFSDLDQLSYLTLRVGRLDSRRQETLRQNLEGRAVIISIGTDDRILAAASRKGRFALDTELKKMDFIPIEIPEGFRGIPPELISGLEERLKNAGTALEEINAARIKLRDEYALNLQSLIASYLMVGIAEKLKARLKTTKNVYLLSGWVQADMVGHLVAELEELTEGRIAVRSYDPEELEGVKEGKEKVPVSLDHGAFVKGFENLVFSYGAPLYGTIDPTPFVAVFFTVLFGIMFGDLGQGLVLLLLGLLTSKKGPALFANLRKYSVPLIAVGISSMAMGALTGEFFTNETLLQGPTRAVTALITGRPMDRILTIIPLPEKGGSVKKLFYFFGFTVGVGIILNSIGLIVNVANNFFLKKYEKALFPKTGLAGLLLFWYAVFIALRFAAASLKPEIYYFSIQWFDTAGLLVPIAGIFFGAALWRFFSGKRPVFEEGVLVFILHGFVEILETVSTYVSNTVSFLRVGAFALSHAVLAYIVFRFSEEVAAYPAGTTISILILIFGNSIIILLEGLIVAIQVVRLQYYEFFGKFFTEMGVEFSPFRFRKVSE